MNRDITDERLDGMLEAIKKREEEAGDEAFLNIGDALMANLILEIKARGKLLEDARKLIEGLEWLDDNGRECAWCHATRHTFNKPEVMGTPKERKARDNHRENCHWLAFVKATESLAKPAAGVAL